MGDTGLGYLPAAYSMFPDRDKPPYQEAPEERPTEHREEVPDIHGHDRQHAASTG